METFGNLDLQKWLAVYVPTKNEVTDLQIRYKVGGNEIVINSDRNPWVS